MAVMHFTLLVIVEGTASALAGRLGALSRNLCGMVGASSVLAGRVGALSRKFCVMMGASNALAGAISVFSVLV